VVVKTKRSPGPQGQDGTTQRHLPFSQIKENIIIMKDGSVRVVLKCTTINFLLKSTEEQDGIIISFQRFLNSLDFPVQIMVRSAKLDINGYLDKLQMMAVKQQNTLLQNQTYEYIEYLRKLVEVAQIMKKEFYIVVPYDMIEGKSVRDTDFLGPIKNFWKSINGAVDLT
jgi:type IV secretory pathway VirB4 component